MLIGGNRYFGLRLAKKLLTKGHQLTLLNRGSIDDDLGNKVRRIFCDRSHEANFKAALAHLDFDVVFDQVCFTSREALIACEVFKGQIKKYIFTSTASVYDDGVNRQEGLFDPLTYPVCIEAKPSGYQLGKRQAESVFHQKAEFPVLSVRFPIVLGEDDYTRRLVWHIDKIKKGEEIFLPDVNVQISLVHAQDAADFLFFSLETGISGPVNVSSVEPISLKKIISLIEGACDKKVLLAKSETKENSSPFGFRSDSWLNVEKMLGLDFHPREILEWLPELISPEGIERPIWD